MSDCIFWPLVALTAPVALGLVVLACWLLEEYGDLLAGTLAVVGGALGASYWFWTRVLS